jgi:Arc/MetJ family transcription regulator
MTERTAIEIDEQLLARAKRAARQREYLDSLATYVDLEVLASDEMWR